MQIGLYRKEIKGKLFFSKLGCINPTKNTNKTITLINANEIDLTKLKDKILKLKIREFLAFKKLMNLFGNSIQNKKPVRQGERVL